MIAYFLIMYTLIIILLLTVTFRHIRYEINSTYFGMMSKKDVFLRLVGFLKSRETGIILRIDTKRSRKCFQFFLFKGKLCLVVPMAGARMSSQEDFVRFLQKTDLKYTRMDNKFGDLYVHLPDEKRSLLTAIDLVFDYLGVKQDEIFNVSKLREVH